MLLNKKLSQPINSFLTQIPRVAQELTALHQCLELETKNPNKYRPQSDHKPDCLAVTDQRVGE